MAEDSDVKLLQDYLRDGSQAAFAELVARHADWIYSMALRVVHDRQMAEDVTQGVFLALSQNAAKLGDRSIQGWLFLATRFVALTALRTESRREKHERQAAMMQVENLQAENAGASQSAAWESIAPNLEECVARLRAREREAVLLRFYQGKSLAEVGRALGVSEEAARKRVTRSVDKLRSLLRRGGVAIPSAELTALFVFNATHATPPLLKASCASLSVSTAARTFSLGVRSMIRTAQLKTAVQIGMALILIPSAVAAMFIAHVGVGNTPPAGGVGEAPPASAEVAPHTAQAPPQVVSQAVPQAAPPVVAAADQEMESWWNDLAEADP